MSSEAMLHAYPHSRPKALQRHGLLWLENQCPITKGLPTVLYGADTASLCAPHIEQARKASRMRGQQRRESHSIAYRRCLMCKGNAPPPELTIKELP